MIFTQLITATCLALGGGHAELHPAASNLYFELPQTQAALEAYEQTSLYRALHDQEVLTFVAQITGEDPETFDLDGAFQVALQKLYSQNPQFIIGQVLLGDVEALSLSVSGVELRGLAELLTTSNFEWSTELDEHLATLQLRVVVEYPGQDEAALAKLFGSLTALLPIAGAERVVETAELASLESTADLSIWRKPDWLGREFFATRVGSRFIFGLGVDAAGRFARDANSLASDEDYLRCGSSFGESAGVGIYELYYNLSGLSEIGQVLTSVDEEVLPTVGHLLSIATNLFHPGDHLEGRSRTRLVDGRFISEAFGSNHDQGRGLGAVHGQAPVTASSFQLVPAEAVGVWGTTIDKQALGDFLIQAIAEATGEEPDLFLGKLDEQFDLHPRRDIVESLGGSMVFYTMPFSGIGAPKMFIALELSDHEAFSRGVETLGNALVAATDGAVEFRSRPYRKSPFMAFSPGKDLDDLGGRDNVQLPSLPSLFSPSLAIGVLDGRAIISLSNIYTKREMKRLKKEPGEPHALASPGSAIPEAVVAYGMTDWGAILGSLYGTLKGWLPLLQQGMGGGLPFDIDSLPGDDLFARYITPSASWSRRAQDGVYTYGESSFGPEIPTLVGGMAAGWLLSSRWTISDVEAPAGAPSPVPVSSPTQATRDSLSSVKVGLVVYKSDLGHYPAALSDLTKPSTNFPEGYLAGPDVPKDGWGRALHYELSEDGSSFRIWSSGPNGVDDAGGEDDVNQAKRR